MLREIGVKDVEELYEQIPERLRFRGRLDLPEPIMAEAELSRHLRALLAKNTSCEENLSFLGGGCWQHYVPAVCEEITSRAEFLSSIWGSPSSDLGRNQAWFEFCSQMGELVNMDIVGLPCYSWGTAAGYAIRMASRITGRHQVLLPSTMGPERLAIVRTMCEPEGMPNHIEIVLVAHDPATGLMDIDDLQKKISAETAAVYFENPSYLGCIESQGAEISRIAHQNGAESVVGVDPISLGVLAAPADYGADIIVGDTQPLGIHMNCGGGCAGFIATRDEVKYLGEYPTLMVAITDTQEGEVGFGFSMEHQTSYGQRDQGKDWTGCTVYLWTIQNAVYMSLLGPQGFKELGQLILQRAHYAAELLSRVEGVKVLFDKHFFKEFVVNFDGTGKTVAQINKALLGAHIFGGKDLSVDFPTLGESALYCVTEMHSQRDIERLVDAIAEVAK
jgi:glycine dehydrogenase subunit 1